MQVAQVGVNMDPKQSAALHGIYSPQNDGFWPRKMLFLGPAQLPTSLATGSSFLSKRPVCIVFYVQNLRNHVNCLPTVNDS